MYDGIADCFIDFFCINISFIFPLSFLLLAFLIKVYLTIGLNLVIPFSQTGIRLEFSMLSSDFLHRSMLVFKGIWYVRRCYNSTRPPGLLPWQPNLHDHKKTTWYCHRACQVSPTYAHRSLLWDYSSVQSKYMCNLFFFFSQRFSPIEINYGGAWSNLFVERKICHIFVLYLICTRWLCLHEGREEQQCRTRNVAVEFVCYSPH